MEEISSTDNFEIMKDQLVKVINERLKLRSLVRECMKSCLQEVNSKKVFEQDVIFPNELNICTKISFQKDGAIEPSGDVKMVEVPEQKVMTMWMLMNGF